MAVSLASVICFFLIITPRSLADTDVKLKNTISHLMHQAMLEVLSNQDTVNDQYPIDFMKVTDDEVIVRSKRSLPVASSNRMHPVVTVSSSPMIKLSPVPRISRWDEEFFNAHDVSKTVNVMQTLLTRINGQSTFLSHLLNMIKNAIRRKDSATIFQHQVFRDLVSFQTIHMKAMRGLRKIQIQGTRLSIKDLQIKLDDLKKHINALKQVVTAIELTYSHVAFRNQPTRMSGSFKINTVHSYVINSTSLAVGAVNDVNMAQLMANAFLLNKPKPILGRKFFPYIVVFNSLSGSINGVDLSRAVLNDRPNVITAPVSMNHLQSYGNLFISSINGIVVGRDTINLRDGSFRFTSPVILNGYLTTINSLSTSRINSLNLDSLLRDVMVSDKLQVITGPIIIRGQVLLLQPVSNRFFNGFDLPSLANDLVRLDQPVVHLGSKAFAGSVRMTNGLYNNGTINGISIPRDLFFASSPQTIVSPKTLIGHHTFDGQLVVKGPVDGLRLPQDIVTLTGPDTLPPVVFAKGIDVFSSMTAGLVDSVDLSNLAYESIKASQGVLFNPVFKGPVFVNGDVSLTGLINGQDILFLQRDIIFRHQLGVIPIKGSKIFKNLVSPYLQVDRINGYPLSAFATVASDETLPRLKFITARFNRTQVANGMIGGANIPYLYANRISLSIPGFLPAKMNFIHQLRVTRRLTVAGRIQDLIPNRDFVLKSAHQEITGSKNFGYLRFAQQLTVRNAFNCRLINGIDVQRIYSRRISLSQPQFIDTSVVLSNSRANNLIAKIVNRINLQQFLSDVMVRSKHQVISGEKIFYSAFNFGDVVTSKGVDGISLASVDKYAIHLHGNSFLYHPMTFLNSLIVRKNVIINGRINDISWPHFLSSVLMKTGQAVINGPLNLLAPLTVAGKIEPNRVNSMWLPHVILLKNYDQVIRSNVSFSSAVFRKNLAVSGRLMGLDLDQFDRSIMKTNRPNVFTGDLTFKGPLYVNSHVEINGLVSGIDVRRVALQTMYKAYDQTIQGQTTIHGPVSFSGNVRILRLNNRDLRENLNSLVYLRNGIPAVFTKLIRFNGDYVHAKSNVMINSPSTYITGPTNNLMLAQLFESLVYTNRPSLLNGPIRFADDIYARSTVDVAGTINQINLYKDVLFRVAHPSGKIQTLTGSIRFDSLWSETDIDVLGQVNGLHLPSLLKDSLLDYGAQDINGRKYFSGSFIINNNSAIKNLNNISNIADELIHLNQFQYFKGSVDFINPIRAVGDVSVGGRLAGFNFTELLKNSLYKNIPQSVTGKLEFDKLIFHSDVNTAGPVNKIYLHKFYNDVNTYARSMRTAEKMMSSIVNKQLQTNSLVYDSLVTSPFELSYFDLQQKLPGVHGNYFETQGKTMYSVSELDKNGVNSTIHQVRYKRETQSFEAYKVERNVPFIKRVFFSLAGKDFSVHRASFNSEIVTEIRLGTRVIATLDAYIDDFTVLVTKEMAVVASLLGLKGQIKVHTLRYVDGKLQFNHVALLKVGPSANKMVLFVDNRKLFLAVARSFRGQCSVGDYGSLLFQLIGNTFKLVQRVPVNDANHVVHYEHRKRHYLAFSDAASHYDFEQAPGIHVFYMKDGLACHLMPFSKLHFDNLRDLSVVSFGPMDRESILLVAINSTTLTVWKQEGIFGFPRSWSMPVSNGQAVYPVSAANDLFLIASQGNKCTGSLVYRAVFSGASLKPLVFQRHWSSIS